MPRNIAGGVYILQWGFLSPGYTPGETLAHLPEESCAKIFRKYKIFRKKITRVRRDGHGIRASKVQVIIFYFLGWVMGTWLLILLIFITYMSSFAKWYP